MFVRTQTSGIRLSIDIRNGKPVLDSTESGMTAASIFAARTDRLELCQTADFLRDGAAFVAKELGRPQVYGWRTATSEHFGSVCPDGVDTEITEEEFIMGTTPLGFNLT